MDDRIRFPLSPVASGVVDDPVNGAVAMAPEDRERALGRLKGLQEYVQVLEKELDQAR